MITGISTRIRRAAPARFTRASRDISPVYFRLKPPPFLYMRISSLGASPPASAGLDGHVTISPRCGRGYWPHLCYFGRRVFITLCRRHGHALGVSRVAPLRCRHAALARRLCFSFARAEFLRVSRFSARLEGRWLAVAADADDAWHALPRFTIFTARRSCPHVRPHPPNGMLGSDMPGWRVAAQEVYFIALGGDGFAPTSPARFPAGRMAWE